MRQPDGLPAGEDQRGLQALVELADVARPGMAKQRPRRIAGERRMGGGIAGVALHQRADQQSEVLATLAQRRQSERQSRQARQQIAAKLLLRGQRLEILLGRSDHAEIDRDRLRGSHRPHLGLLQDAREERLCRRWQLLDGVEEEGAAVGVAHQSPRVIRSAGKGPLAVPEQLRVDEGRGERAAIDRNEPPRAAGKRVKPGRDHFLARAGLAADDDGDRRSRDGLRAAEIERERGQQCLEPRRRWPKLVAVAHGSSTGRQHDGAAEEKERVPELDQIAIAKDFALDAAAVQERPVPRARIGENPAAHHPAKRGMGHGHPVVGNRQRDPVTTLRKLSALEIAAPDGNRVDAAQRQADRGHGQPIADEGEKQMGRGAVRNGSDLSRKSPGGERHASILPCNVSTSPNWPALNLHRGSHVT